MCACVYVCACADYGGLSSSFGGHVQKLEVSSLVHKVLAWALGSAGVVRIVEICFVLNDQPSGEGPRGEGVKAWQHLYPYLLTLTG